MKLLFVGVILACVMLIIGLENMVYEGSHVRAAGQLLHAPIVEQQLTRVHMQQHQEKQKPDEKRNQQQQQQQQQQQEEEEEEQSGLKSDMTEVEMAAHVLLELFRDDECQGASVSFSPTNTENHCVNCVDVCGRKYDDTTEVHNNVKSFRIRMLDNVQWPAHWSLSTSKLCRGKFNYRGSDSDNLSNIRPSNGCVAAAGSSYFQFEGMPHPDDFYTPVSYHVMYNVESSIYMGYQSYANWYAFSNSGQQREPPVGYTRVITMTSNTTDDIAEVVPSFVAPRDPRSRSYGPFNKPTGLTQLMQSKQAPTEEVMVIIDPDSWLTWNLGSIAAKVKPGLAVADPAFFYGSSLVVKLWKEHICTDEKMCEFVPDNVGVPYYIHREDFKKVAPLWAEMTDKVLKIFRQEKYANEYRGLQPGWCAEMYGYVFACAALGIKHQVMNTQLRDVGEKISWQEAEKRRIRMIHMGRAWFPKEYADKTRWVHTEGKNLRPAGTEQVWCKCNATAADERPWPLPPGIDWVSNITLTALHESLVLYGNPQPNEWRPKNYHQSKP